MARVWQCDRCKTVSSMGNEDDPPDDWAHRSEPVRGSTGARSSREAVLCDDCDDSLYAWFHPSATPGETT